LHEAGEGHVDRSAGAEVEEILGRKRPSASLAAHSLDDFIGYGGHFSASFLLDNNIDISNKQLHHICQKMQ
jgi:hypothetical protein